MGLETSSDLVLDEEQEFAVSSESSLMVIAGPGSGKTRVLTEKARRIQRSGKSFICLTFTRSAAKEMASRVLNLPATTIHSLCNGVVGWKSEWGYDGLLKRFLWEQKSSPMKVDWVLLDEAQDVNDMELDVVLSLVKDKVFIVGDPFQSIYGFQGALGYEVIRLLERRGVEAFPLKNNYRSTQPLVNGLNTIYPRGLVSVGVKTTSLTAILCRTNDDVSYVSKELRRAHIPHRIRRSLDRSENSSREQDIGGPSNLRLMTIHVSKGLEFDKVILFGWKPQFNLEEEKRVYYVAMSRASKKFVETDIISGVFREALT